MWKEIFLIVDAYMIMNTSKYQRSYFVIVLFLFGGAFCFCFFVFFPNSFSAQISPLPPFLL